MKITRKIRNIRIFRNSICREEIFDSTKTEERRWNDGNIFFVRCSYFSFFLSPSTIVGQTKENIEAGCLTQLLRTIDSKKEARSGREKSEFSLHQRFSRQNSFVSSMCTVKWRVSSSNLILLFSNVLPLFFFFFFLFFFFLLFPFPREFVDCVKRRVTQVRQERIEHLVNRKSDR